MLPCFEDPRVGAAGQSITPHVPLEPRDDNITLSGAAAIHAAYTSDVAFKATYAAARWSPGLEGGSVLYRTDILCDQRFLEAYTSESWHGGGHRLEAGGDYFLPNCL